MTNEMLHVILKLALTKLIELPPATLKSYEPWLTRKHIRACLNHIDEFRFDDPQDIAARMLIRNAAHALRKEEAHALCQS